MASVIFDRDLRLRNIILEGNTLEITQVFQKEDPLWQLTNVSQFDRGLEDYSNIQSWSMVYTRREANMTAHLLAKAAIKNSVKKI
jgi:hypothetical protein